VWPTAQVEFETPAVHGQNFNCTGEKHLEEIEKLYAELTSSLLAATSSTPKTTGRKKANRIFIGV